MMTFSEKVLPKEGIGQNKKQEWLKSVISKGKEYLLGRKWTQEKVDKASDETINKTDTRKGRQGQRRNY